MKTTDVFISDVMPVDSLRNSRLSLRKKIEL